MRNRLINTLCNTAPHCFSGTMASLDWTVVENQAKALFYNLLSWSLSFFSFLQSHPAPPPPGVARAVQIDGPGGLDRLRVIALGSRTTVGYNVPGYLRKPFVEPGEPLPDDCVEMSNEAFSVNYADVTIRWGLYESALRFVGWPIVPGFDVSGTVARAGKASGLKQGDRVYGFTLFGAYSSRVMVPGRQLMVRPPSLSVEAGAALPAVAGTALHALALAGFFPDPPKIRNRGVLIHSAAGGVGSMLVQMAKLLGCSPVVRPCLIRFLKNTAL